MSDLVTKYDRLAEKFAEREYANLRFYMQRRFTIAATWGRALEPGDSVLELGCGDGYLAQLFVQNGLHYSGGDISRQMVTMAERRLQQAGLKADFTVIDVTQMSLSESFDAVVAYMRTFFTYVRDPLTVLKRLRPSIRKKILLDLAPRRDMPLQAAIRVLEKAGFRNIAWRPFCVPQRKKLPVGLMKFLTIGENMPVFRKFLLHWKFVCVLKGEV